MDDEQPPAPRKKMHWLLTTLLVIIGLVVGIPFVLCLVCFALFASGAFG